jgi:competence protein ComEA
MKAFAFLSGLLLGVQLFAINLNTATVEELSSLKGIGEGTAKKIIQYRNEHAFKRIDELMNVKGIGQKKFDKIKDELSI